MVKKIMLLLAALLLKGVRPGCRSQSIHTTSLQTTKPSLSGKFHISQTPFFIVKCGGSNEVII